ncbi:DUF397 domain-containing protein [Spirillospora sp. NPDC047279]|uniref:DUF397 domain-containing protein n=1 Tax=Spirillospora sp. NPDC047279 TaxID=3155478 RepID=UPI0033FB7E61
MKSHDLSVVRWRKGSRSSHEGGECVEVAGLGSVVAVRDSKDPGGVVLVVDGDRWRAFTRRLKRGLD